MSIYTYIYTKQLPAVLQTKLPSVAFEKSLDSGLYALGFYQRIRSLEQYRLP